MSSRLPKPAADEVSAALDDAVEAHRRYLDALARRSAPPPRVAPHEERTLGLRDVAQRLGMSPRSVRRIVDRGLLPSQLDPLVRRRTVRESDLLAYIESRS